MDVCLSLCASSKLRLQCSVTLVLQVLTRHTTTLRMGIIRSHTYLSMQPITPQAAIMRQGLLEMRKLSEGIYPSVRDDTFFGSCGVADLIASCYGG